VNNIQNTLGAQKSQQQQAQVMLFKKRVKDLKRHLSSKNMHMANKYMTKVLNTSCHPGNTNYNHHQINTPVKMASNKKTKSKKCW
jgi:hypothetical protein